MNEFLEVTNLVGGSKTEIITTRVRVSPLRRVHNVTYPDT